MTSLVATAAPAPIRRGSTNRRKQLLAPYLFVLPFFVVFVAMLVVPLGYAAWTSLFRSRLIGGKVFAGLDNYTAHLPTRASSRACARRSSCSFRCRSCSASRWSSRFLDRGARGSRALRLLIFLPYAVPGVVATLMWGYLYGRDFGPIGQAFRAVGLERPTSSRNRTCSARS